MSLANGSSVVTKESESKLEDKWLGRNMVEGGRVEFLVRRWWDGACRGARRGD